MAALVFGPHCRAAAAQDAFGPVRCTALREKLTQPRWLSLPESRLVVNPFEGQYLGHSSAGSTADGVLPLDLAYYTGAGPIVLPEFWSLQANVSPQAAKLYTPGLRLGLSDTPEWQTLGVTATFGQETVRVTSPGDFGALRRTVTVDLKKTPSLIVQTAPGSPAFDLKVNSGSQPVDTWLHPAERFGAATIDIAEATGWHGVKTFQVLLYVHKSNPVTFTRIQFFRLPASRTASRENIWMPHAIAAQAQVGEAAGKVSSVVTLPDTESVSERLHIGPQGPSSMILTGRFPGTIRWDAAQNTLLLQGNHLSAAICVSRKAEWQGIRPTALDWAVGEGRASSSASSGVWHLALTDLKPGDDLVIAACFAPSAARLTQVHDAVKPLANTASFNTALASSQVAWNRRLALVPRPRDFTAHVVEAKGVSAADVRRCYYRAWIFFFQDTLPPMPENGFLYPQVCTGKPSLWTDGAPGSEETAVWDGVVALQALALVAPNSSWKAAQGLLSQVGADGYLPGEMLPTVYAQTLWLLYRQTGDLNRLRIIYPALKRFLVWRIAHPYWVWPNKSRADVPPSSHKSNEFVLHEIVDLGYAIEIAQTLGQPGEAAFWQEQRRQAAADFLHWFRPDPSGPFYEDFDTGWNPAHAGADIPWTLKGLQMPMELLPLSDRRSMVDLFHKTFRQEIPFGIPQNRFGDLEPVILGLFQSGQAGDAEKMAEMALRDVTRAGEFSEDYTQAEPPEPNGVRPSAFGARLMIDSALWHNGVVLDQGYPVLLGMPNAAGVDNIPVHGAPMSIRFDNIKHTVTLRGPGLAHLHLPRGFRAETVDSEKVWIGPIAEGRQIPLF